MLKTKGLIILGIILVSLLPVYLVYKYLQRLMRPKESLQRFFLYLLVVFMLVFGYTFLLVFVIRLLFPEA